MRGNSSCMRFMAAMSPRYQGATLARQESDHAEMADLFQLRTALGAVPIGSIRLHVTQ